MSNANPYNARKPWDNEVVEERGFMSADDSLFYMDQTPVDDDDETVESVDDSTTLENGDEDLQEARDKSYRKPNYKKRYDDLKRHYDRKLAEHKAEKERILAEARASRPSYKPPKTPEDLATFREEYPDVYDVVETVAHMRSQEQLEEMKKEIERLRVRDRESAHEKAKNKLLSMHPDFEEIASTDEFHEWAKKQPTQIQDWVYRNGVNADLAARAMDLYKKDSGIFNKRNDGEQEKEASKQKQQKRDERASAAEAVSVSAKPEPKTSGEKIWSSSEIARLSLAEYEKYRDEIDAAFASGRVRKG